MAPSNYDNNLKDMMTHFAKSRVIIEGDEIAQQQNIRTQGI